jgi:hypothetical protein
MNFDRGDSHAPSRLVARLRRGLIGVNPVTGVRGLNQDASEVVGVTLAKPTHFPPVAPKSSGVTKPRQGEKPTEASG